MHLLQIVGIHSHCTTSFRRQVLQPESILKDYMVMDSLFQTLTREWRERVKTWIPQKSTEGSPAKRLKNISNYYVFLYQTNKTWLYKYFMYRIDIFIPFSHTMKKNLLLSAAVVAGIGIGSTEATLAQTTSATSKSTVNVLQSNPLDSALKHVKAYYPDMETYLTTMVSNFPSGKEQKDTVNAILAKTVMHIKDTKQMVAGTIYFLEACIYGTSDFRDSYDNNITEQTLDTIIGSNQSYIQRRNRYITRLDKQVDAIQTEIDATKGDKTAQKVNLEVILKQFIDKEVGSNMKAERLIRKIKLIYKKERFAPVPAYIQKLFDVVKVK